MSTDGTDVAPGTIQPIAHLDVEERIAIGKAARAAVPRSSHATWAPGADRPDPVTLLRSQEVSRVPALIDLRHERMLASPFAFYRGAAIVMASDLAMTPSSDLRVQCCGDAHLANFGGFASPDRRLVFDINDFDETNPGPFEWDVKRLTASFEIAARSRELGAKTAREITLRGTRSYREAMSQFAAMSNLETWYARLDVDAIVSRWQGELSEKELKRLSDLTTKAESKDSTRALSKLATKVDGEYRIKHDPPLVVPIEDLATEEGIDVAPEQVRAWLSDRFRVYRQSLQPDRRHLLEDYRLVDFARKVVGVGSVGTRCWIALMMGRDDADPLFLQIKEAQPSVLEPFTGASEYSHHGQRVVEGQRLLQTSSDILLGWVRTNGIDGVQRDFYARQLWDWKVSADLEGMSPTFMKIYAEMCGWTLARGHARSGDRVALAAYLGSGDVFDRAIADFASAYADQNQRDYDHAVAVISGAAQLAPLPQPA
ncbi:MAG TPA: DUF2252 domain-containing protein [Acidimicrobiia bacterium]|nr:DUF2252 domain-containing protein [Acidimicrobiia bacterium]